MRKKIKLKGADLASVLSDAVSELTGEDAKVSVSGVEDLKLTNVFVQLEANLPSPADDEASDDEDADVRQDAPAPDRAPNRNSDRDTDRDTDRDEPDVEAPSLDAEADAAADFVEGILDAMDLPGELKIRLDDEHEEIDVEVVDIDGGALIGRRGQTLEAIQELLRSAMQREFQRRSRVMVDVEGYRSRRLEKLVDKAEEAIEDVLDTGESQRLEPMDVFERKAVHRLVATHEGVTSRSQGREPGRRIVIEVE